jgi:hypothetical protein
VINGETKMTNEIRQKLFEDGWKDIKMSDYSEKTVKEIANFFFNYGTILEEDYLNFRINHLFEDEVDEKFLKSYISEEKK